MKRHNAELSGIAIGVILGVLTAIGLYGLSWIATCGVIKLITMCFGWTFKWTIATGIWLVICIAKNIFSHNVTIKKIKK